MSLFLCYDWLADKGKYLGLITDKHPQKGTGTVTILSVETADTIEEIREWFREESVTRPWETRQ